MNTYEYTRSRVLILRDPSGLAATVQRRVDPPLARMINKPAGTLIDSGVFTLYIAPCGEAKNCCRGSIVEDELLILVLHSTVDDILRDIYNLDPDDASDQQRRAVERFLNQAIVFEETTWAAQLKAGWESIAATTEAASLGLGTCADRMPCKEVESKLQDMLDKARDDFASLVQRIFDAGRRLQQNNPIQPNPNFGRDVVNRRITYRLKVDS